MIFVNFMCLDGVFLLEIFLSGKIYNLFTFVFFFNKMTLEDTDKMSFHDICSKY